MEPLLWTKKLALNQDNIKKIKTMLHGLIKSPTFLKLFNKVSVALFSYRKLHTSVSMVTSPIMVTVIKQWVQPWDTLLHNYGSKCHTTFIRLPWLPYLPLDSPRLSGASFVSTSEV
jgi:hypothetical protein